MVKKTYFKTIRKTLTGNISRFLVICLVVMLGVAFVSGLGTLSSSLTESINEYYKDKNGLDIIVKSKNQTGFTNEEIESIKTIDMVDGIRPITLVDNKDTRLIIADFNDNDINTITIKSGRKIENYNEILVDRTSDIKLDDNVNLLGQDFKVVGIVDNPTYYVTETEKTLNEEDLKYIYYLDTSYYDNNIKYIITDLYIKLDSNKLSKNIFNDKYKKQVNKVKEEIESNNNLVVLTLEENMSYVLTKSYGEKIDLIASIFPLFFILISCLVVYSTINRLIEEERGIIGCYRSLGISKGKIIIKYLLFTFLTCLIGSVLGFFIGINLLPAVIYPAFDAMFIMPKITSYRFITPGIATLIIMSITLCLITIISTNIKLKSTTSDLLKPKSPKSGKKILLEKITFVWKGLKFKYKSSLRNIFRYKINLIMTVISVAGSTALTFAGLGLYAIVLSPKTTEIPISMASSFALISLVIVAFAAILCILVVFNITNMNIQERTREIATLRVLGYQKKEVSQYIYREINITTIISIISGMPLGYIFLNFIFKFLEFGSIKNVNWYYYLITMVMVMIFVLLAEALLNSKIKKVDMNGSLKSNE